MCATVVPAASVATTWPEKVVSLATFAGSRERTASAVPPAGTVSVSVDSVYAASSVSVARFSVTSVSPALR